MLAGKSAKIWERGGVETGNGFPGAEPKTGPFSVITLDLSIERARLCDGTALAGYFSPGGLLSAHAQTATPLSWFCECFFGFFLAVCTAVLPLTLVGLGD